MVIMMMTFKTFREEYKRNLAKGQKFILKDFNIAWKKYSSEQLPTVEPIISKPTITVEQQEDNILQPKLEQPIQPIYTESAKSVSNVVNTPVAASKSDEFAMSADDLIIIANSIHQTLANIAKIASNGVIVIDNSHISALNKLGARLIKKYDKNDFLEKWFLEVSYGVTMLNTILTGIMAYYSVKKIGESMNVNKDADRIKVLEKEILTLRGAKDVGISETTA